MNDMTKTDRKAIMVRITKMLDEADDKMLREIDRLIFGWIAAKRKRQTI